MKCTLYNSLCNDLFKLLREYIDLDSFSETEVFKLIMSASEYDIMIPVSTFVKSAFKHRDNVDI